MAIIVVLVEFLKLIKLINPFISEFSGRRGTAASVVLQPRADPAHRQEQVQYL